MLHRFNPESQSFTRFDHLLNGHALEEISTLTASPSYRHRLWVGTRGQGVFAFNTQTVTLHRITDARNDSDAFSRADVLSLEEDQSQILWVGTFTGLNKALLHTDRFSATTRFSLPDSLGTVPAFTLYESRTSPGVVWIGTMHEGLVRLDRASGTYEQFFTDPDHPLNLIFAINEDPSGHLWLGGIDTALYRLNPTTGGVRRFPLPSDVEVQIRQFYRAPSQPNVLWTATRGHGLFRTETQAPVSIQPFPGALSSDSIWTAYEPPDSPGQLWVGTHGGGLHRVNTGPPPEHATARSSPRVFDRSNSCLPTNRIVSIASERDSVLWLGTFDNDLIRFNPESETCTHYTPEDGLAHVDVAAIIIDDRSRLWMTTSNGLSLFNPEHRVFTNFTASDGLRNTSFFYHAHHQNDRGEVYVGGRNGFDVFHPDSIVINPEPPAMAITELTVNGTRYPLERHANRDAPITLGYGENDLTVRFAALDLRRPERNRYKVRLHEDQEWTSLGHQASARFFSLSPGQYALKVIGANSVGYWNRDGVGLQFRIKPPFWRTWWFWTLFGAIGTAIVAAGYQYRLRQRLRVERTRQRIADDLHDDIGSKISNVALKLDLAGRNPSLAEEERHRLDRLSAVAKEVVNDLRDTVWLVDAGHDRLPDLTMRMEQFTEQLLNEHDHEFHQPDELPSTPISMDTRRHLYLFFKEALHNAVRHGQPQTVSVTVGYDSGRLTLRIYDDGAGFNPKEVDRGRGLKTMQKRAEAIGGEFSLEAAPGRGTTVRLSARIT